MGRGRLQHTKMKGWKCALQIRDTSRKGILCTLVRRERVRPPQIGECGRCHILGSSVQRHCDGVVARVCHGSPGAGKDLVGPPTEQERVGALVGLVYERRGLFVEERRGPSAACEAGRPRLTTSSLLDPPGTLHRRSALNSVSKPYAEVSLANTVAPSPARPWRRNSIGYG
jgi:hypothetical protein